MVELKNIKKIYNKGTLNEFTIFEDFNFKINTAEFVSVVGSNGSGKTSLLNCISGDMDVDKGEIYINGINVTNMKVNKRYKYIGRVYQYPDMGICPNLTILENMAIADHKGKSYNLSFCVNKKRIEFYKEKLKELELGLEDKINTNITSLSGGQKQAVSLVMATLTPIHLLVLDEHTASLDPKTSELIMKLTSKMIKEQKLTAIMVTHNLSQALKYGSRLIVLKEGKIKLDRKNEAKNSTKVEEILNIFNNTKQEK